ncbi:MAG TPA: ribosomal protein S18-alanine N-acetyltransferase [Dissulfurispiraceae bacterium]|nr:ribosomal protein S18-alanine N-acetyltransferase [Dissulfurispiraceae bacterium]
MDTVVIRDMLPEDVPDAVVIERSSFTMAWSENSFYSEVYGRYSITRVAAIKGRAAGYVIARIILDEGHLLDLAVHPGFRRMGVARMLLEDVIRGLRINRCRAFYLEVRESNAAARGLYENMGFTIIGTRKTYYKNPVEDACIMMLEL